MHTFDDLGVRNNYTLAFLHLEFWFFGFLIKLIFERFGFDNVLVSFNFSFKSPLFHFIFFVEYPLLHSLLGFVLNTSDLFNGLIAL
jgi:hypothetical protein